MDRAILIWLISLISFSSLAQSVTGKVVDEAGIPILKVNVSSIERKVQTDKNGIFSLIGDLDTLTFEHPSFELLKVKVTTTDLGEIRLKRKTTDFEEIKIIQKRLNNFDVGYLPPVRGVQIATGTSSIIQTESQSGAKSTGNPREMFAKIPGLNIWESDGAGIQIGVGGRGLSPNRAANFNTRQNGYDISADALGYPESYYTPPLEALSSIEIIRGSASLQYGTQFGGLMNFVIKDPVKTTPLEFTSRSTVGSFGYLATFNRISGSRKRWQYQVYHQVKKGDGYRKNSQFEQHQVFAQLGYYLTENTLIRLEYTGMHYDAQQPGGLTDGLYKLNPIQSVRDRNWFRVNWNMLALHFTHDFSNRATFNVRAFGMSSNRYSLGFLGKINQVDPGGNREMIAGDFLNGGIEARYLKRYSWKVKSKVERKPMQGAFLVGGRFYQGETQSKQGLAPTGDDAEFRFLNESNLEYSSFQFPSRNLAFFVENILFISSKFTFNAGARLEYIQSSAEGFYKRYAIHPLNFDTLGIYKMEDANTLNRTVPLAGIGGSYKVSRFTNLYANYCMNYRAVNFNDIRVTNPNVIVDTLMRDEYGSTTEVGFRGLVKPYWYVDIAFFYLFYGDKIGLAPEPNGINKIRTNIGDARNYGVELFTEIDWFKLYSDSARNSLTTFVNFSYIQSEYIRSKESNYLGKQVEYVSPIMLRVGLKYQWKGLTAQVQYSYNQQQFSDASNAISPSGDAVIGLIPAYDVMDLSVRYAFKKWIQLETGVNNVLNETYFTRRATAYPGPGILPSDGRSFYVTVQFQFRVKNKK